MRVDTFCDHTNWQELQASVKTAEARGYNGFAVPEIHGDPFLHLAVAAMASEKIELRTAIAVAFPRSPMMVANSAWAIHHNSGGRFVLGLGTQVKGHNERRFSTPWGDPRGKMKEYVESLRAIWRCWEKQEKLNYVGEHYQFTLMTPEFMPKPMGLAPIPVYVAGVRPSMMETIGSVADGIRLHGFCTRKYLEETALPAIQKGLDSAGRARAQFEVCGGGFIATGATEDAVQAKLEWIRYRIAFYASTRTYLPVMETHGWDELAAKLHEMSKQNKWKLMAGEIPDEVLHTFAVSATYKDLAPAIEKRFGGLSDCIELVANDDDEDGEISEVLQELQGLSTTFQGHSGSW